MNDAQESQIEHSILARAVEIRRLADCLITELQRQGSRCDFATKQDLRELRREFMSKIIEFGGRYSELLVALGGAFAAIKARIAKLEEHILFLQNNPGPISPEDQAVLDKAENEMRDTVAEAKKLGEVIDSFPTTIPVDGGEVGGPTVRPAPASFQPERAPSGSPPAHAPVTTAQEKRDAAEATAQEKRDARRSH